MAESYEIERKTGSLFRDRWMPWILLAALLIRIAAAVYWHHQAPADQGYLRLGDSHGYWVLAQQIAEGMPYQYGSENAKVFRAPLLPLLLAPLTQIGNRYWAVLAARLLGCLLGVVTVYLTARLSIELFEDERLRRFAARSTAVIAALYPGAVGMSVMLLSEMLFMPCMLCCMLLWIKARASKHLQSGLMFFFMMGLFSGIATLVRPSWLLFLPWITCCGLLLYRQRRREWLVQMAVTCLGLCLAMMPWWIRNYHVTGKFVLTTLQVGPSLYDSFQPGATGGSDAGMQFMRGLELEQFEADKRLMEQVKQQPSLNDSEDSSTSLARAEVALEGTFEWRLNQRALRAALLWCQQNPSEVLWLAWAKFRKTWALWPDGGELGSRTIRAAVTLGTFGVLLLAILASYLAGPNRLDLLAIYWSPCLYFTLLHMVFVGSVRYREPAMVVLVALAGCATAYMLSRLYISHEGNSRVDNALSERDTD